MRRIGAFFVVLTVLACPSITEAQREMYPHLQIFLVPSQPGERSPFITFWDGSPKLAAGPFPIKLLERVGLNVLLDVSYSKPNDELPGTARLKIQTGKSSSLQNREDLVLLDQPADLIAARGASKMFSDGPFLMIGHKAPSEGVLQVEKFWKRFRGAF